MNGENKTTNVNVALAGKPSSTVVLELRDALWRAHKEDPAWKADAEDLHRVFEQITKYSGSFSAVRTSKVPDAAADMWKRVFQQGLLEGDVHIRTGTGQIVRAHRNVLEEASPVLKAMLGSSFSEGQSGSECGPAKHTIHVEESERPVQILLELLYTGSFLKRCCPCSSPEVGNMESWDKCLLQAFQICHRWHLAPLTDIVEIHLVQATTIQTMEGFLDSALLHGASQLRRACIDKAAGCPDLMNRLREGTFGPSVQNELQKSLRVDEPAGKKRRL